jgi:hypothetical protein
MKALFHRTWTYYQRWVRSLGKGIDVGHNYARHHFLFSQKLYASRPQPNLFLQKKECGNNHTMLPLMEDRTRRRDQWSSVNGPESHNMEEGFVVLQYTLSYARTRQLMDQCYT